MLFNRVKGNEKIKFVIFETDMLNHENLMVSIPHGLTLSKY